MRKTKLTFIMLIIVLFAALLPVNVFAMTGSGTEADPFVITSEADLKLVNSNLAASYILGSDVAITSAWSPIGSVLDPFKGVFDGDGFTITGLTESVSGSNVVAGLFAYNSGEIKNLTVELGGSGIVVNAAESAYVGGIAACNIKGKITSCHVEGSISVTANTTENTSNVYVGLVVGKSTGEVTYTNANGSLTAKASAAPGTKTSSDPVQIYAGGLIGLSTANQANNYAIVDIDATAVSTTEYSKPVVKAGGVTGENSGYILDTYAVGNITAHTESTIADSGVFAGGLIGKNSGKIEKTNASGNVSATTDSESARTYAGGLIGYSTGNISESYATGLANAETTTIKDAVYAGGLLGFGSGLISQTYATGKATASASGALELQGGLVGYTAVAAVDSYYRNDSGYTQLVGCGSAKTEEQLKVASTYSNWDFDNTWKISSNQNSGYPYLLELYSADIVFQDAEYTYDGTEKVLTATGIPSGATVEYVNNKATEAGVYNAVAIVTAKDYNRTVVTAKLTINKKEITISGLKANDKDFDNTTTATIDASDVVIEGVVEGDDVSIDASSSKATFASKNVGENIEVTISDIKLIGADADNYTCGTYITTAHIFDGDYADVMLDGSGTIADPYLISDEGELNAIRGKLDANFKLTRDIVISGEWIPIGRIGRPFEGSLEGNGFTISGMKIPEEINYTYSGLFGYTEGNISNLKVDVSGDIYTTADNAYIGAIAGFNAGVITNCSVTGEITTNPTSTFVYVGGIAGLNGGTITYSDSAATIQAYGTTVYAGGVVGENSHIIENTGATGDVRVIDSMFAYAGGFAGNNLMTIRNSYATGDVVYTVSDTGFAGNVGGFAGRIEGGTISHSYSAGKPNIAVESGAYLLQDVKGGFAAYNAGVVTGCYYDSTVSGLTDEDVAMPKTTSEMHTMSTYTDWSEDLWRISSERNGGYPYIKKFYSLSQNAVLSYNAATNTITVEAYTDIETACLIAASYSGGALVDIDIITPIELDEGTIVEKAVKSDFEVREGGSVKVMLWENMTTIRPLCSAKEVAIR